MPNLRLMTHPKNYSNHLCEFSVRKHLCPLFEKKIVAFDNVQFMKISRFFGIFFLKKPVDSEIGGSFKET